MQPRVVVVEDALLAPQLVGPRPDAWQPERRLRVAVLALALGEYEKYADAKDVWNRHRFAEVEAWFRSDEADWPFSFAAICEALGLDVSYARGRGRSSRTTKSPLQSGDLKHSRASVNGARRRCTRTVTPRSGR